MRAEHSTTSNPNKSRASLESTDLGPWSLDFGQPLEPSRDESIVLNRFEWFAFRLVRRMNRDLWK
ncbi:MAG TPA: hypothetical protein VI750_14950, partial [Pyrinomonadaceae bacterium]|nr:hypothetical protein [Pyrinomonadaceae bacterium]